MTNTEILPPLPAPEMRDVEVLLASNSPRRRELLKMILPTYSIAPNIDINECYPSDMPVEKVPEYLASAKADAHESTLKDNQLMITADTVVILDGKIYGKPHSREDAIEMIEALSGRSHKVVTGVAFTTPGKPRCVFSETTTVHFAPLTRAQIEDYVDRYRPFDKAGAYGVQEWIGAVGIEGIDGCFYNVMGLPLSALYKHLRELYCTNR